MTALADSFSYFMFSKMSKTAPVYIARLMLAVLFLTLPQAALADRIIADYDSTCCTLPPYAPCCEEPGGASECIDESCGPTADAQEGVCRRNRDEGPVICVPTGEAVRGAGGETNQPALPVAPTLSIDIPTVQLSGATRATGRYVDIPWLADYITGIFRFALPAGAVIAVVIMMVGGLQWLTSSGNSGKIGKAQKRITDAAIGLALIAGSYALLNVINPNLVLLPSLRINMTERETFVGGYPDEGPDDFGTNAVAGRSENAQITISDTDCQRLAELVQQGEIRVRMPNDREGLINGGVIRRTTCQWCYSDQNIPINQTAEVRRGSRTRTEQSACTGDGETVAVNPKMCSMLVAIYDGIQQGQISMPGRNSKLTLGYIIGAHSRCSKRTEDVDRCTRCIDTEQPDGTHWGQSNHWRGNGIDLPPNDSMQQFIAENLASRLQIKQVYGPAGWDNYAAITCPTGTGNPLGKAINVASGRSYAGSATSPYNCQNGRCGVPLTAARPLCGHLNHIHVGFGL